MNAANAITVTRILLIPVFLVLLFVEVPYGEYLAVAVFALAAGTDKLDGYVARRSKTVTAAGMFLDPLADKLLVSAALIALVSLEQLPAWVAMVIIGREFAVTGLRVFASAQGVSIPADRLGKLKTISQIAAIIFLLVPRAAFPGDTIVADVLIYTAVALTLVSGIEYFWNARDLLTKADRRAVPDGSPERPPCSSEGDTGGGEAEHGDQAPRPSEVPPPTGHTGTGPTPGPRA
jgi:CDP-diacylglycerol---glycerol-3-phosphate 3-phosphatidyltransferase